MEGPFFLNQCASVFIFMEQSNGQPLCLTESFTLRPRAIRSVQVLKCLSICPGTSLVESTSPFAVVQMIYLGSRHYQHSPWCTCLLLLAAHRQLLIISHLPRGQSCLGNGQVMFSNEHRANLPANRKWTFSFQDRARQDTRLN